MRIPELSSTTWELSTPFNASQCKMLPAVVGAAHSLEAHVLSPIAT
jgi:hypothetical protein